MKRLLTPFLALALAASAFPAKVGYGYSLHEIYRYGTRGDLPYECVVVYVSEVRDVTYFQDVKDPKKVPPYHLSNADFDKRYFELKRDDTLPVPDIDNTLNDIQE